MTGVTRLRALLVCHAGNAMGLGHWVRTLVLARALRDQLGTQVEVLVQGERVQRDA